MICNLDKKSREKVSPEEWKWEESDKSVDMMRQHSAGWAPTSYHDDVTCGTGSNATDWAETWHWVVREARGGN